jgi:hypothetical protein
MQEFVAVTLRQKDGLDERLITKPGEGRDPFVGVANLVGKQLFAAVCNLLKNYRSGLFSAKFAADAKSPITDGEFQAHRHSVSSQRHYV